jgi:hypothetical protein
MNPHVTRTLAMAWRDSNDGFLQIDREIAQAQ